MMKQPPTVTTPVERLIPPMATHADIRGELEAKRAERERRVKQRRRRRLRQQRTRRLLIVVVPFLIGLSWHLRPVRVQVEGRTVWAWPGTTVARAVKKAGVEAAYGDLLDVRGHPLAAGFGHPPIPVSGGRPISYAARARAYRSISVQRGLDRREATREQATLLPAAGGGDEWEDSWKPAYLASNTSVAGMARHEFGSLSGLPAAVERAVAFPIAAAPGSQQRLPKRLALTFDDGPNGETTRELLSLLSTYGARATFFLLGQCVVGQEEVVRQQVADGHEIGNHSWDHPLLTRRSVSAALENIEHAERIISAQTGTKCRWFRPPYGGTNSQLRKAILEAGYNIALWSADTEDWRRPGSDTIYGRIMDGAEPGAIILMHDGGPRDQTIAACRQAIPDLMHRGYELVTLSELEMTLPRDEAGVVLLNDQGAWDAHVPGEPIRVFVHGRELAPVQPMLAMSGKILLPAPQILDALGAHWEWDRESQTVAVSSARGRFRLRMDSRRVLWDDREVPLEVPPILYHDVPLVPAEALARTAAARLDRTYSPTTLRFSFANPVFSPRPRP